MKNLMNLKGAKVLNRIEQKAINGGAGPLCQTEMECQSSGCAFTCLEVRYGTLGFWYSCWQCVDLRNHQ